MPYLFFEHEAVLMRSKFIVDHLVDLILQEGSLLFVQDTLLFELASQGIFGDFEVVLHHHKRIMEDVFQYLHLLLDNDQLLFGVSVQGSRSLDRFFDVGLGYKGSTMRFLIGISPIIVSYIY